MMITATSCAKKTDFEAPGSNSASSQTEPSPDKGPGPSPSPDPDNRVADGYQAYPLLWESVRTAGKDWSNYVFTLIQQQAPSLIQGADDIATFCPNYAHLTTNERVNLWGLLVSAITKYESGFDPTSRMQETTMGIDPVTGEPVFSEGLLQLSYQDIKAYSFCDEFNWSLDKNLNPTDPRKTILDPYKNLKCGVKILAQQIRDKNRITLSKGVYWSVIKINGKYSKIMQIATLTKKMPGCMN